MSPGRSYKQPTQHRMCGTDERLIVVTIEEAVRVYAALQALEEFSPLIRCQAEVSLITIPMQPTDRAMVIRRRQYVSEDITWEALDTIMVDLDHRLMRMLP